MIRRDPSELGPREAYKLLTGTMVPRPIAFVSTLGADGVRNLAPFSWNTAVSTDPPMLAFTANRLASRHDGRDDTLRNIEATGEFVYNLAAGPYAQRMVDTSAPWAPEVDEFAVCGLTPAPSSVVQAPRVAESPVSFECRLERNLEMGGGSTHLLVGRVVAIHVADELMAGGVLDMSQVVRIGRMAGVEYVLSSPPGTSDGNGSAGEDLAPGDWPWLPET